MVIALPLARSSRLFVVVLLAAGVVATATDSIAQAPPRGGDRPVQRTLPRNEIYAKLGTVLDVGQGEAKSLVQSVEDKGFPLRETVVLLLLGKARADRLIEEGKFSKEQRAQVLTESAEHLVGLVQKEKAGWLVLVQKTGAKVDLSAVVAKANQTIGFFSERVGVSRTVPVVEKPIVVETKSSEEPAQENPAEQEDPAEQAEGDK
jgi:hypothetical protein